MSWKVRMADRTASAARARVADVRERIVDESAASRLLALREMRDDQPITIEALLVLIVDAVHEDQPRALSKRDVKRAGVRRHRVAGGVGMFGGPIGLQIAKLYSEAEIFCDVADRHRPGLSDEELAAHLLVMWNAMPDLESARAAIDGSGESVATRLAGRLRRHAVGKPLEQMTKKEAVLTLWRLSSTVKSASLSTSSRARGVLLPGKAVKATIRAAEHQLGVR